jgi:hypothetical protein
MQVAGRVKPRYSLVGDTYNHDYISFSPSVRQRLDLQGQCLRRFAELVIRLNR